MPMPPVHLLDISDADLLIALSAATRSGPFSLIRLHATCARLYDLLGGLPAPVISPSPPLWPHPCSDQHHIPSGHGTRPGDHRRSADRSRLNDATLAGPCLLRRSAVHLTRAHGHHHQQQHEWPVRVRSPSCCIAGDTNHPQAVMALHLPAQAVMAGAVGCAT